MKYDGVKHDTTKGRKSAAAIIHTLKYTILCYVYIMDATKWNHQKPIQP